MQNRKRKVHPPCEINFHVNGRSKYNIGLCKDRILQFRKRDKFPLKRGVITDPRSWGPLHMTSTKCSNLFHPIPHISAFGTYLNYKMHITYLTTSTFVTPPPQVRTSRIEAPLTLLAFCLIGAVKSSKQLQQRERERERESLCSD